MTHSALALAAFALILFSSFTLASPYSSSDWEPGVARGPLGAGVTPSLNPTPAATATPPRVPPSLPAQSGPGRFLTSSEFRLAQFANRTCVASILPGGACPASKHANVTNDLAMNYTSAGILAVAYTTMTNASPCGERLVENYSQSNIAFTTSLDNGATWSSVQVLGNGDCNSAATYPSSWEPALTSLGNGTLVLAYVEYNTSVLVPFLNSSAPPVTQLVVTESYTNGASWTPQQVVNVSSDPSLLVTFPAMRPSIAAFGNTVYLTWMSMQVSASGANPGADSQVSLIVSGNGGKTWSPTLPMTTSPYTNSGNPEIIVNPAGRAFLAYASGLPYSGIVYVLSSTNDFTSWTTGFVASTYDGLTGLGPFGLSSPRMAWNSLYHELYVAFVGGVYSGAPLYTYFPDVFLATSVNNGSSFLSHVASKSAFFQPSQATTAYGNPYSQMGVYQVELAVTAANNLQMEGLFVNNTLCRYTGCGFAMEVAVNSSNNGTTYTGPFVINGTITTGASGWAGEDTAMVSVGSHLWYGWEQMTCPTSPTTLCSAYQRNPAGPLALTQAVISQVFTGTGTTMTFHATGLNTTTRWLVNVMGNIRSGNGTFALSVSGVPTGVTVFWALPGPNVTPTVRFYATGQTTFPPTTLTGALVDNVTFTEYDSLNVSMSSTGQVSVSSFLPSCLAIILYYVVPGLFFEEETVDWCADHRVTPSPTGTADWVPRGIPVALSVSPVNLIPDYCMFGSQVPPGFPPPSNYSMFYYIHCEVHTYNVTFLSWTGTGNGSVTSTHANLSITPEGPASERANFILTGTCQGEDPVQSPTAGSYSSIRCYKLATDLTFAEHGLPGNRTWGVSVAGPDQVRITRNTSANPTLTVGGLYISTAYTISPLSIPTAAPGMLWIGTVTGGNQIVTPDLSVLNISYALESDNGTRFDLNVSEEGLPTGSTWAYSVSSGSGSVSTFAVELPSDDWPVRGGTSYSVNGSFVPGLSGVGYSVSAVTVEVCNVNATVIAKGAPPGAFNVSGDVYIVLWYTPAWWLTIEPGSGGRVTPSSSEWIVDGTSVTLTAYASPGELFVGWTGYGVGASDLLQRHSVNITILPGGPVTEIATFAPAPLPTWTLQVMQTGLPVTQPFSLSLGGTTYTGAGTFAISNLSTRSYAVNVPYAFDSASDGVRYVPNGFQSSAPFAKGVLNVSSNGTVWIAFGQQVLLEAAATSGGTVSVPAATWEPIGVPITILAAADPGSVFEGWGGVGRGSVNSTNVSVTLVPEGGPISETASFAVVPAPVPELQLIVRESGLPPGTGWNLTADGQGAAGNLSTLNLSVRNGTYSVFVPSVYVSEGVRYAPSDEGLYLEKIVGNSTLSVSFSEQFMITVSVSGNGTVNGIAAVEEEWVNNGATIALAASTGSAKWTFSNFEITSDGTRPILLGQPSISVAVDAPTSIVATFLPVSPSPQPGSTLTSWSLAAGVLGIAAVVGGGVGGLIARRARRLSPRAPPTSNPPRLP